MPVAVLRMKAPNENWAQFLIQMVHSLACSILSEGILLIRFRRRFVTIVIVRLKYSPAESKQNYWPNAVRLPEGHKRVWQVWPWPYHFLSP